MELHIIHDEEDIEGSAWAEIVKGRGFKEGIAADFGIGEECYALLEFEDGTFEVGVGEALRPYLQLYLGKDRGIASEVFHSQVSCAYCDRQADDIDSGGGSEDGL